MHEQRVEMTRFDLERPADRRHRAVELVALPSQPGEVEPGTGVARTQRDQGLEGRLGRRQVAGGERLTDLLLDGREVGGRGRWGHAGGSVG